jgi:hypothetical protein
MTLYYIALLRERCDRFSIATLRPIFPYYYRILELAAQAKSHGSRVIIVSHEYREAAP